MILLDAIEIGLALGAFWMLLDLRNRQDDHERRIKAMEARKPEPEKRVVAPVQVVKQPAQYEKPVVPGAKPVKAVQIGDGKLSFDEQNQIAEWV